VAQKLHDTYNFSYDNLKVLLGGWNAWKTAGYPIASSAAPTAPPVAPTTGQQGPAAPTTNPGGTTDKPATPKP
jgi:3-mercaptopyruvate sulfurtransferase SseA